MRNKTTHLNRFAVVILLGVVLGFGILLTGCGSQAPSSQTPPAQPQKEQTTGKVTAKPPAKVTPPATPAPTAPAPTAPAPAAPAPAAPAPAAPAPAAPAPAAPAPATPATPEDPLLVKIMGEKDIFALYSMKQEYEARADKSEAVVMAFKKRQDELVSEHKPQTAIDGCLDFVAFDSKKLEGGKHLLRWYYVVTNDITDEWLFNANLKVDKAHVSALPEDRQKSGFLSPGLSVNTTKITSWKKGEHKILTLALDLKDVPYEVLSMFYKWSPEKKQIFSKQINHGWLADVEK